jgi:DNA-binding response OmpR family regulator
LARLRAVTRRSGQQAAAPEPVDRGRLKVRDLLIDTAACRVALSGREIELTPIEFRIINCLAQARGRVLSREHILQEVSGRGHEVFDRSLDMHISSLRRKLGDSANQPQYIKTVRGFGYMLLDEPD